MNTSILAKAALAASLALASCGGGAPTDAAGLTNAGYEKYDAQDYEGAQADFQAALDAGAEGAALKDATLGLIRALAHTNTEKASQTFQDFASANADLVVAKDYSTIGGELVTAGGTVDAIHVVDAGLKRYDGDAGLTNVLEKIKERAAAGDAEAASALSGLGYL